MARWITARLPWTLLAFHVVMVAAHLLVWWQLYRDPAVNPGITKSVANVLIMPSFITLTAVGALVASRHPGNSFGWLLCGIGLFWETYALLEAYAVYAFGMRDGEAFGSHIAIWARGWMFYPALCLTVTFVPLLFPSGHLPRGRWRIVFWLALVGTLCASAGFAFEPITYEIDPLPSHSSISNPYAFDHWSVYGLFLIGFPLTISAGVAAGVSIVWRLRRARGVERQQLKWVAYVGAFAAAIFAVNTTMFLIDLESADRVWILQLLSFAAFPIAAGIAIVRHQLFDIDRVINRTLVYGLLTLSLGFVYVLLILLPTLVIGLGGSTPDLLIAGSTLAVAGLFRPLRSRIHRVVDRRFYRSRYDAARTVERFSARMRDEVDLASLTRDLTDVIQETVQPTSAWVWLRPSRRYTP